MGLGIPPTTIALACLATLSIILFSLALLVDWIRNWRHVRRYWAYGVGAGLGVMALSILQVVTGFLAAIPVWSEPLPSGWEGSGLPVEVGSVTLVLTGLFIMAVGLLFLVIGASRVAGFTMLGIHYATELGHPSFPLLQRLFGARRRETSKALSAAPPAPAALSLESAAGGPLAAPPTESIPVVPPATPPPESAPAPLPPAPPPKGAPAAPPVVAAKSRRDYAVSTLGVTVIGVAYSAVLFWLTSPRASDLVTGLPDYTPNVPVSTLQMLVVVLSAAFSEELIYRLGIQGFLARYLGGRGGRYWLAIGLSALLWTMQHVGVMEPGWVKLAQVFPVGLMLGWLYRRNGVESCMVAHALFNLALTPLSSFLIQG